MRTIKFGLLAAACLLAPVAPAFAQSGTPTVPIDVWAQRDNVSSVDISPDGQHIAMLRMKDVEGKYYLEIYKTSDLSKPWRTLAADPMELISARFIGDNYLFGNAWQVVRDKVNGPEDDVRGYKTWSYNLTTNKFSGSDGSFNLVTLLPKEPNKVLIATETVNDGGFGVDPFAAFRPRSYYKYNLVDGTKELLLRGDEEHTNIVFDIKGNPRFSNGVKPGAHELTYYYRMPGDSGWKELPQHYDLDKPENLYRVLGGFEGLVGFDPGNPAIGYWIDNRGEDKAALWEFDFKTGQFGRKLYSNPNADVLGVKTSSMFWAGENNLTAAVYPGAKMERFWFDQDEKKLYDLFQGYIPNAHQVNITGRSRDGKSMIVSNVGPHDPGSYWLFVDGKMAKIASRNPLLKPEQLSDVEFIKYPARDGRIIPAYLTKPKGKGPFPLVVLPHGGPHVNEVVTYDEWGQFLANNGYMVLQPEYRMSVGWGADHFNSAYGQHGLKMQDDKDDGVTYLVKQGLVDPNRVAMFGWSYGGYAALVASQRTPQLYQCAIAGAAVADPAKSYARSRNAYTPKALDEWSKRRGMIGINPMNDLTKTNIPVLMVHGSVDHRVEYWNYKDYRAGMEKAGLTGRVIVGDGDTSDSGASTSAGTANVVPASATTGPQAAPGRPFAKFVTLKGADHFYNTLMYSHQKLLYTSMLDFLKNDCGPGGL